MNHINYSEVNRAAWNEASPIHKKHTFDAIVETLQTPGKGFLDQTALQILKHFGLNNISVAQLCCNNGRELLTIKKLGAGECVGFDISDGFIEQANELVRLCEIQCTFIQSDVVEISSDFNSHFDLVVLTKGTLGWQPNLHTFFNVVSRILKNNGKLFVYEMHPLLDMYWNAEHDENPRTNYSYFRIEPFVDYSGLDFFSMTNELTLAPAYWFHHKISEVLNAIISNGLVLDSMEEFAHDISIFFKEYERFENKLPLSYSLQAHKA